MNFRKRLMNRRRLQQATATMVAASALMTTTQANAASFAKGMFAQGVGADESAADSVVLSTRLSDESLSHEGTSSEPVPVRWQIATDANMTDIIQSGMTFSRPVDGHSVSVEARELPADRSLYYRFDTLGHQSPIGSTRS